MRKRYRSVRELSAEVEKLLAPKKAAARGTQVLEDIVEALYTGRRYFWIGIYLAAGDRVVRQAFRGPVPPCHAFKLGVGNVGTTGATGVTKVIPDVSDDPTYSMCFLETKSEIVAPIKIASRVLGVIDVEGDRVNAFSYKEQILITDVAKKLAKFLATHGKLLMRKAREQAANIPVTTEKVTAEQLGAHHPPQSVKPLSQKKAIAGDKRS